MTEPAMFHGSVPLTGCVCVCVGIKTVPFVSFILSMMAILCFSTPAQFNRFLPFRLHGYWSITFQSNPAFTPGFRSVSTDIEASKSNSSWLSWPSEKHKNHMKQTWSFWNINYRIYQLSKHSLTHKKEHVDIWERLKTLYRNFKVLCEHSA